MPFQNRKFLKILLVSSFLFNSFAVADDEFSEAVYYGENVDYGVLGEDNRFFLRNGEEANPQLMRGELGYMREGMDDHLGTRIVADPNIDKLFTSFNSLRNGSNISLPADFVPLIGFIYGYINVVSAPGTDKKNAIPNSQLAHEIVKASFCFGTDPFMIASKIRRETTFNRTAVSSGSAVGFSQMTGAGIDEVQHQMSGNTDLSVANAQSTFQKAIRCYVGKLNFNFAAGTNEQIKTSLQSNLQLDLIFGQILTKTYISYIKSEKRSAITNTDSYRETFALYNGDTQIVRGQCMSNNRIELKYEYACDVISYFSKLKKVWHQFLNRNTGRRTT